MSKLTYILLLLSGFALSANTCNEKNNKNSAGANQETTAVVEPVKEDTVEETVPEPQNDTAEEVEKAAPPHFVDEKELSLPPQDSIFAMLYKTPCFGTCPHYYIRIYKNGTAIYRGFRNADREGFYKTAVSQEVLNKIKKKAEEVNYFSFENKYPVDMHVADLPSTVTYVSFDGKSKKIDNQHMGPEKLKEFEKYFQAFFEGANWEKMEVKK